MVNHTLNETALFVTPRLDPGSSWMKCKREDGVFKLLRTLSWLALIWAARLCWSSHRRWYLAVYGLQMRVKQNSNRNSNLTLTGFVWISLNGPNASERTLIARPVTGLYSCYLSNLQCDSFILIAHAHSYEVFQVQIDHKLNDSIALSFS